jgi:Fe-S-cluster containining protein
MSTENVEGFTPAKQAALKERRFECQNCGICCSHRGRIQASEANVRELAKHLKVSEFSFAIRYLQEFYAPNLDAYIFAFKTNYPSDSTNGCIFHFGTFCAIYATCRADLCHVFPWNHFDVDGGTWKSEFVADDGTFWCHGIGKGREWPMEEIREVKEKYKGLGFGYMRHLADAPAARSSTS